MLDANALKEKIRAKLTATGQFKIAGLNELFIQAVAEAVVEHIREAAVANGTCPSGGGALQNGSVQ